MPPFAGWTQVERCDFCYVVAFLIADDVEKVKDDYGWECPGCHKRNLWVGERVHRLPVHLRIWVDCHKPTSEPWFKPHPRPPWYKRAWAAIKKPFQKQPSTLVKREQSSVTVVVTQ